MDRLPALLASAAMGVYVLIVVGATTAVTGAADACVGWPLCDGGLVTSGPALIVLGHRAAAVVVGLLVLATAAVAVRSRPGRRVASALAFATLLFPAQAGLGAVVATTGADTQLLSVAGVTVGVGNLHLLVGLAIFGGLLTALGWELEHRTGDPDDAPTDPPTGPDTVETDPVETTARAVPDWTAAPLGRARLTVAAYYRLMKPRLMWLLCLVAAAAMALAAGPSLSVRTVLLTLVGGALSIGASGTFNHVLERDVDRRMQRTSDRPLAVDLVSVPKAVAFGLLLSAVSLSLFAAVNLLAAALGLVAILFYSVVYTLVLKPNTVQNTVIGGAAGALPALIGWAAVTGEIGLGGVGVAAVIFLWTPAHFYNLALAYEDDYERAGFPMLPVVRGQTTTRRHILWYLGATLAAAAVLVGLTPLDTLYAATGAVLGAVFLWAVVRLHYERDESAAFRAFHASNAYLGTLLLAAVVDSLVV